MVTHILDILTILLRNPRRLLQHPPQGGVVLVVFEWERAIACYAAASEVRKSALIL